MEFIRNLDNIPAKAGSSKRYTQKELNEMEHIKKAKEITKKTTLGAHTDYYRGLRMNIVDIDTRPAGDASYKRKMTSDVDNALKPRNKEDLEDVKVVKRKYRPLVASLAKYSSSKSILSTSNNTISKDLKTSRSSTEDVGIRKRNERTRMTLDSKKATENLVKQITQFEQRVEKDQKQFGLKRKRKKKKSESSKNKDLQTYSHFTCSEDFVKAKVKFDNSAYKAMRSLENNRQMNNLITASEIEEKKYLSKTGAFSTVDGYYRRNARKKAKEETSKVLDDIKSRNRGFDLNFLSPERTKASRKPRSESSKSSSPKLKERKSPVAKKKNLRNSGNFQKKNTFPRKMKKQGILDEWSERMNSVMSIGGKKGISQLFPSSTFVESSEEGGSRIGGGPESGGRGFAGGGKKMTRPHTSAGKSFKSTFVTEIKKKSYSNYLAAVQQKRIQKLSMRTKEKHEQEIQNYKNKLSEALNERNNALFENKFLLGKSESKDEEIKSLRYTIQILNAKLSKMTEKEILNEQKLKVFEQYQPLFEHLSTSFHFNSPQDVIDRLSRLEKNLKDSYDKLLTTENEKSKLERSLKELKKQERIRMGLAISEKVRELTDAKRKNEEMVHQLTNYRNTVKNYKQYKEKYWNLQKLVNNIWDTLQKRVKKETGYQINCEPDPTIPNEVVSSIDNWIMAFTTSHEEDKKTFHVCRSTVAFQKFSQLANSYWLRYFKEIPNLKNNPFQIFANLGKLLRKEKHYCKLTNTKLQFSIRKIEDLENEIKALGKKLDSSVVLFKNQKEMFNKKLRLRPQTSQGFSATSNNSSINNRYKFNFSFNANNKKSITRKRPKTASSTTFRNRGNKKQNRKKVVFEY